MVNRKQRKATPKKRMGRVSNFDFGYILSEWVVEGGIRLMDRWKLFSILLASCLYEAASSRKSSANPSLSIRRSAMAIIAS